MSNLRVLTDELEAALCKHLQSGATISDACALVGIGERTYYDWVAWGDAYERGEKLKTMPRLIKDRQRCSQFSQSVKKARSYARTASVNIILKAAQGDRENKLNPQWQAAAWFLERSNPKEWARRTYAKIEGLDELLKAAERLNIAPSDLFNAMLAELASVDSDSTTDSA